MLSTLRSSHGLQRFMLLLGLGLVVAFLLIAIFAPWLAPYDFNAASANGEKFGRQQGPSADHWFGTTVGGTDVLSRVIYGARTAVEVILLAVILSGIIGVPLGLVSGYLGGWIDRVLVLVMDALYSFPSLLLAIVVSIVLSGGNSGAFGGIMAAAISITVVFIPQYFRLIRNATIAVKVEPYVDAARVVGARTPRILFKHIFSNVTSSLPVIATLNASEAILTLAGLGFLGFGIEPSAAAEWGYDLNKALPDASSGIWWTGVFPGTAIVLIVLGSTLVGESLNDILNPLLRTRGGVTTADEKEIETEFAELGAEAVAPVEASEEPRRVATLSLRDLTVDFSTDAGTVHAVRGISFDVAPGEVVAVVGESGSGKSVSSRAMLGLLPPTAAVTGSASLRDMELLGKSTSELRPIRGDQVSMVFQEPSTALNPVYTVGWQISEMLVTHGVARADARARALELMDRVGIANAKARMKQYPHQFSGGQRQRLMIAMALGLKPDILIADEPTTALDVTVQAQILRLLEELQKETDMGLLLITHDLGVVAEVANRVVVMNGGEIVESGSVRDVLKNPVHPYTRKLIAAAPGRGGFSQSQSTSAPEPLLRVESVSKSYGNFPALQKASFSLMPGETLAVVGESGSGKSTLAKTLLLLEQPNSGAAFYKGRDLFAMTPRDLFAMRREIQMVFQDPSQSLNPRMTVSQLISEAWAIHPDLLPKAKWNDRVAELLGLVGLSPDLARRYPHQFSGGQRQRIAIARALALDPRLIICDEAVSALDVSIQAQVIELLESLRRELSLSYLFIAHDLPVVRDFADRVIVMQGGSIVEIGTTEQIFTAPSQPYTRALLDASLDADPDIQAERRCARAAV